MVRVAVAGGTGNVSKEIVSILGESGKHEIVVFTRSVRRYPLTIFQQGQLRGNKLRILPSTP